MTLGASSSTGRRSQPTERILNEADESPSPRDIKRTKVKEGSMKLRHVAWLMAGVLLIATSGGRIAKAASICVSEDGSGGCLRSIQAAVDAAAPGSTILVKTGTYTEQVTIDGKDLVLRGQPGAIIQAPDNMEPNADPERSVIGVLNATVTIRGLIIDGLNSGEENPGLAGISFINAGGDIRHNIVRRIGFGSPRLRDYTGDDEPDYEGYAIQVLNFDSIARHVIIAENTVTGYNSNGITVLAVSETGPEIPPVLTAYVVDNTVVGLGRTDVLDQWGIQIGEGVSGRVRGNRVRGNVATDAAPAPAYAIFVVVSEAVSVHSNVLRNNQIGIGVFYSATVLVSDNEISGPRPKAVGYTGIEILSAGTHVRETTFRNLEVGISILAGATDTKLVQNRFIRVATAVDDQTGGPAREGPTVPVSVEGRWSKHVPPLP
jgi:nitrous oxidase accessory protein NosD